MDTLQSIVVGLVVLGWILYRQLQARPVREERPYLLMVVLGALGLVETQQFLADKHLAPGAYIVLVVSLAVGMGIGFVRGWLVHIWRVDGVLTRQGNGATVVLWLVGLAIHLGIDVVLGAVESDARGLGLASLWLYLALALAAQRYAVLRRARTLSAADSEVRP